MRINRKFSFFACCSSFFYPSPYRLPSVAAKASRDNDDKRRWNEKLLCHCMLKEARREQGKISAWKYTWFHVGCCVPVSPVSPNRHQFALVLRFSVRLLNALAGLNENETTKTTTTTVEGCRRTKEEREAKEGKYLEAWKACEDFLTFGADVDSTLLLHRIEHAPLEATGSDGERAETEFCMRGCLSTPLSRVNFEIFSFTVQDHG